MTCLSANLVAILWGGRFILITLHPQLCKCLPIRKKHACDTFGNVQIIQLLIYTILFAYTYV